MSSKLPSGARRADGGCDREVEAAGQVDRPRVQQPRRRRLRRLRGREGIRRLLRRGLLNPEPRTGLRN